jgi:hypothetical protein
VEAKQGSAKDGFSFDVGLEETCRLSMCGLVGRLSYRNLSISTLPMWVEQVWTPLLGYTPELLTLTKGWFGFLCNSPEDVSRLLESNCGLLEGQLMLKRWRVAFNPVTEYFQHRHLWVLLPGLPLHFWNEGSYKQSGTPWAPSLQLTSLHSRLRQKNWENIG